MARLTHKLSYRDRVIATALALAILALIGLAWGLTTSILTVASTNAAPPEPRPEPLPIYIQITPSSVEWSTFIQPHITYSQDGSRSITFQVFFPWSDVRGRVQGGLTGAYSGWELNTQTSLYDPFDPWASGPAFYVYGPLERRSDGSIVEWIRFPQCDGVFWEQDNTGKTLWKRYCIIPLPESRIYTFSIKLAPSPTSQYEYIVEFTIDGKTIIAVVKSSADALDRITEYATSYNAVMSHVYPGPPFPKIYTGSVGPGGEKTLKLPYAPLTLELPALEGYTYRATPDTVSLQTRDAPGPFTILEISLPLHIFTPVTTQVCTSSTPSRTITAPYPPLNPTTTITYTIYECVGYSTATRSYTTQITLEAFDQQGNLVASLNINLDDILQQLGLDQEGDNRLVYAAIAILVITLILVMRGGRR